MTCFAVLRGRESCGNDLCPGCLHALIERLQDENVRLRRIVDRLANGDLDLRALAIELEAENASLQGRLTAARSWVAEETDFESRTTSDDRGQW